MRRGQKFTAVLHKAAHQAAGVPLRGQDIAEVRAALDVDTAFARLIVVIRAYEAAGARAALHVRLVRAIRYLDPAVFGRVALLADAPEQRARAAAVTHRADDVEVLDRCNARVVRLAAGLEEGAAAGKLELDQMTVAVELGHLQVGVVHGGDDIVGDGAAVFRAVDTRDGEVVHEARVLLALLVLAHLVQLVAPRDEVAGVVDEHGVFGRARALQLARVGGRGSREASEHEDRD